MGAGWHRERVRLATFNLFSGRSLQDGRADAETLAEAVRSLGADVLAMQEVDRHQPRSGGVDQAAVAAAAMGATELRFVPLVRGTPGTKGWQPVPPQPGDGDPTYGIALATRGRVEAWRVLRLGRARGRYPIMLPTNPPRAGLDPGRAAGCRRRSARGTADDDRRHAPVVRARGRTCVQLRRLRAALRTMPAPRVLLGDLNLPGGLPARVLGWRALAAGATFPSQAPRLQIDHVLG